MQKISIGTVLLSLAAAVAASLVTVALMPKDAGQQSAAKTESAYDRVIRTNTLRCGYTAWPPYFSMDPNTKELTGLSKEMSDAAARLAGLKVEYVEIVLGQAVQDLNNGKIDAMCGDGPWVISTIQHIDYSKAYQYSGVYAYGRADETRFTMLDDLNRDDVQFTGIDGDLSSDLVAGNFPKAKISTMASMTDPSQLLLNVTTGKADVAIIDPLSADIFMKNNPDKLKLLVNEPVAVYGAGFSVKKGEEALLGTLNEAVSAVINTGAAARILKKYDPKGEFFLPVATPYKQGTP